MPDPTSEKRPARKCANRTDRTLILQTLCFLDSNKKCCFSSVAPRQRGKSEAQHNKIFKIRGSSRVKQNKPARVKIPKGISMHMYIFFVIFPLLFIFGGIIYPESFSQESPQL